MMLYMNGPFVPSYSYTRTLHEYLTFFQIIFKRNEPLCFYILNTYPR